MRQMKVPRTLRTVDDPVASRPDTPPRPTSRWLPGLSVGSAVAAYALIIFGSQVRVSDSGMGCPDWPLCKGNVGPIYEFHALMEQTHRYLAAIVTILAFVTATLALRARTRPAAVRPAVFTVGVIVVQIALGALTVIAGNAAPTVAAHLIAGVAMLGGATVTAVCALVPARATPGPRLGPVGWVAIGAAGVLFFSGSLVVNAGAEQACASFPLCPPEQPGALVWPHLVHRGIAVFAGIALLTFSMRACRRWSAIRGARALAATLAALVVATATLGVVSALLKAPPGLQDLHLAGAAAVLAASVALAALGWLTGADCPANGPAHEPGADRPIQAQPAASTGAQR
jgi:heme A synthase